MARLQRLRGLLGLSIASAIAWIPLGAAVSMVESLIVGGSVSFSHILAGVPEFAAVGAFCGFAFGLALAAAERKRAFESLNFGRFVALGFASALVIPAAAMLFDIGGFSPRGIAFSLAVFGAPGALTAAALLAIARRAPAKLKSADSSSALSSHSS